MFYYYIQGEDFQVLSLDAQCDYHDSKQLQIRFVL